MKQVHNYLDLSLTEINKLLKEKTITPKDLVLEAFERVEQNKDLNSFITLNKEEALKQNKHSIYFAVYIFCCNFAPS